MTMNTLFLEPTSHTMSRMLAVYWVEGREPHEICLHKTMFLVDKYNLYEVAEQGRVDWSAFQWRVHPNGHVEVLW